MTTTRMGPCRSRGNGASGSKDDLIYNFAHNAKPILSIYDAGGVGC